MNFLRLSAGDDPAGSGSPRPLPPVGSTRLYGAIPAGCFRTVRSGNHRIEEKERRNMFRRLPTAVLTVVAALAFASGATAQRRPTIAIMPAQHSQPDARSAENVTRGLVDRFEAEQYRVIP